MGKPKSARYAIWWLDQASHEVARGSGFVESLPAYIQAEVESRRGRAGRGRLWVPSVIGRTGGMTDTSAMDLWGSGDWGGIVIFHRDRAKLAFAPGFVTDFNGHILPALTNAMCRDYPARVEGSTDGN